MSEPVEFESSISSNLAAGSALQEMIVQHMERFAYSMRDIFAVRLSLEEALTNSIKHGNKLDESKQVHVNCRIDDVMLHVRIRDEGAGFDPNTVPDATLEEFIERPTGRGLLLIRAYMNHCEFSDDGRTLIIERERNSPLPIMED
jgi:serine/threonine-protein kinase RsbW